LSALAQLFIDNLLPIFIVAGLGYLLGKFSEIDPQTISRAVLYIFAPSLIFRLLIDNHLSSQALLEMAVLALLVALAVGLLAWLLGSLFKFERSVLLAVALTAIVMNAGNYGLSLNLFAFGQPGAAHAGVYFITMWIITYTVGVFLASLGKATIKDSAMRLFKYPLIYAAALAIAMNQLDLPMPIPFDRAITTLSQASIPSMLVLLGVQLQKVEWSDHRLPLAIASILRLGISPLAAIFFAGLLGLQATARQAGVMEAAMPSAVTTIVLATEFNLEPAFVTTMVTITTLLSPLTITPLLAYLGA
jgi:hypothetical protein